MGEHPPDPLSASARHAEVGIFKRSVPMLCPSICDVLATPLMSRMMHTGYRVVQSPRVRGSGSLRLDLILMFKSLIPMPPPIASPSPSAIESTRKRAYKQRIREIEHDSFTSLVLSATVGLGIAATTCYKKLASMIATKHDHPL